MQTTNLPTLKTSKGSLKSPSLVRFTHQFVARFVRDALYRESIFECQTPFLKKTLFFKFKTADGEFADLKTSYSQ